MVKKKPIKQINLYRGTEIDIVCNGVQHTVLHKPKLKPMKSTDCTCARGDYDKE